MKVTPKSLPESRREVTVELTGIESAEFFEEALSRLAKEVKITGFRPGKAPLNLVRDQLEPEKLREEAYSLAVRDAWRQIVSQIKAEDDKPIEDPAVEIVSFAEGQAGTIKFAYDVRPIVTIKDPKTIKLTGLKKKMATVAEVDEVLQSLSKGRAKTIVKLEPAKTGDKVEVSFGGYLGNVKQDKLSSKHFPIVLGEQSVIPGFAEQLIGLKKGEGKTFELKFPADHFDKTLASQTVRFEVTIDEVFDIQLPTLDDEFAKQFGHDNLANLKKAIQDDLQKERDAEFFTQQKAKWLAEFEKLVKVDLPQSLIRAEVNRARQSWLDFLARRHLDKDAWLKQRGITEEQLAKDWQTAAHTSVTIGLGLAELAQQQKRPLTSNEDYQKFLDELVTAANK